MSYILEEQFTSKNFTAHDDVPGLYGMPRDIEGVTIHHWGNKGQDFNTVRDFLCTNNTPTSAHFVAMDGLVSCIVTPENAAWHAGNAEGNATTIGIECRPEATDGDYNTVADLLVFLAQTYNSGVLLPMYPHNHWYNTSCPGDWDLGRLQALAQSKLSAPAIVPESAPTPAAAPVAPAPAPAAPAATHYEPNLHWEVDRGDLLSNIAAYFGTDANTLAKYNGIANPDLIRVGEWIWPPVGRDTWTVDPGDTLSKIAANYGITVDSICFANGINDPNSLAVGTRLQIP